MIKRASEITYRTVIAAGRSGLGFTDPLTGRGAIVTKTRNGYAVDLYGADDSYQGGWSYKFIDHARAVVRNWVLAAGEAES